VAISDVIEKRRLSLHSKTVIITTLCLIIGGTLAIYFTEGNNLQTIGGFSEPCKWMASYFQAVTPRTAGFNTIDIGKMHGSTLLFTIFLMFVGASPGGTGGGVKTTTFTIFIATIWATLKGWKDTVLFRRRIPYDTVRRAFMVISLGALWVCGAVFFLYYFDRDKTLLAILFEVVSAFGTVGLSTGITPYLSAAGKMIIMLVMFVGRVGPLTLLLALTLKQRESKIEYPKEGISIG
jgi:trk system potassium uptake protein TrkH